MRHTIHHNFDKRQCTTLSHIATHSLDIPTQDLPLWLDNNIGQWISGKEQYCRVGHIATTNSPLTTPY